MSQHEATLSRAQKAAAILVAMGKPSAGRLLRFFKQEELKVLIDAARALRTIPQSDLERIVSEFEEEFTEGAGLLDSADQMNSLLNESLSADEMNALMGWGKPSLAGGEDNTPFWPKLEALDPAQLGALIRNEHPQTIAMIFSNLASEAAAGVLLTFDKPIRTDIVKRMLAMRAVQPGARLLVENKLRELLYDESAKPDASAGQARVAGILNALDKDLLDEMLVDLEASGAKGMAQVKARLFSFEDIVLLDQKSRVTLFDGLSTDVVTMALRGASAEVSEAALSAIGARSRRMVEAELSANSDAATSEAVARARKLIASTAIGLGSTGLIELPNMQDAA